MQLVQVDMFLTKQQEHTPSSTYISIKKFTAPYDDKIEYVIHVNMDTLTIHHDCSLTIPGQFTGMAYPNLRTMVENAPLLYQTVLRVVLFDFHPANTTIVYTIDDTPQLHMVVR